MANLQQIIAILAFLGGAFFCGLVPLGFAAFLFFSGRQRRKTGLAVGSAKRTTVAALKPGTDLVRLQGRIAAVGHATNDRGENARVYQRLKVEIYETSERSGWNGLADKTRGVPFQLEDGSGIVWVDPEGLDKQLLGDGSVPDENQIEEACTLLGISPALLRGKLRFHLWEFRVGQVISVIGTPLQMPGGLMIRHVQGQPFVVSPLLGPMLEAEISAQSKKARIWMLVLGIPGAVLLLCGLSGALVTLVRMLLAK